MATYTLTQRPTGYPHSQMENIAAAKVKSVVFSGADAAAVKGSALAVNDVLELLTIPAGSFVISVTHKVTTVEGATCTYSIGDGAGTAGYVSGANGNTTTDASSFNATTTPTFGVGKYYSAADTIDLLLASGTAANVVIKIAVAYIPTTPLAV